MNSHSQDCFKLKAAIITGDAEATLRVIAGLPSPEGLEDRMKAILHQAPRRASLLRWPARPRSAWMESAWARSAAAAAIVFVVAGGGWEIYSRVQPAEPPRAIALPPVAAHAGFSSANAIRTPRTLNGTVLTHPLHHAVPEKKPTERVKKPVQTTAAKPITP
jgi:hypothetical protein